MNSSAESAPNPLSPELKRLFDFLPSIDFPEQEGPDPDEELIKLAAIAGLTNYDPTLPDEVSALLAETSGDSGAYCVWNYPLNGSQGRVCHLGEAIIDRYLRGELIILEGTDAGLNAFREFQESQAAKADQVKAEVL